MATIEKINGKNGTVYRISVSGGFDTQGKRIRHRTTYKPATGMTERQIQKAVQRAAADFERSIEMGYALDNRQTFAEYSAYVVELKERTGAKHRTISGYKRLMERTNKAIGHLAIQDIRPAHLNRFYKNLSEVGIRETAARAIPKGDFRAALKEKELSMAKLAKLAGVAESTVNAAGKGEPILKEKGEQIARRRGSPSTSCSRWTKRTSRCLQPPFWPIIGSSTPCLHRQKRKCWCHTMPPARPPRHKKKKRRLEHSKPPS